MATSLTEERTSHMIIDEFSPEPEYPPIKSNNSKTSESTLPRFISFEIGITESLSQPDTLDHDQPQQKQLKIAAIDLSQPMYLDTPEEQYTETKSSLEEEEVKLIDWVFNMYVPTCKRLLECCQGRSVNLIKLQQYLKLLSNSITFFCNEHQQIQKQKEMSFSKSFTGLDNFDDDRSAPGMFGHSLSPPPLSSVKRDRRDSQSPTSVSVKVLRSISSYLLPPLLRQVSGELTSQLFRDIVVAIQKISWRVEACISFCDSFNEASVVHDKVFSNDIVTSEMRGVMIASPPEDFKIQNSPAHLAVFGLKEDQISLDSDMELYWERQRRRDNSIGDMISQEAGKEGYFRPGRRTTVSISKRQIQSLGLNVVDATAPDSLSPKRSNTVGNTKNVVNPMEMDSESFVSIRDRVLKKLAKEFPQFQTESDDPVENGPKRPSTLPMNSDGLQLLFVNEPRASSAPLPPINQGPIQHMRVRERHSHEPPSTIDEEVAGKFVSNLGERTKSLEFERLLDTTVSPIESGKKPSDVVKTVSSSTLTLSKSNSNTMPKRRETFVKMVKKKAKSFGRADSRVKQRTPIYLRSKTTSEFFSPEDDNRTGSESPIEQFVLKAHPREGSCRSSDYNHYLNIDILDKICLSPRRRRFSVSTNIRHPTTIEMNVSTDIPDLEKERYTIHRSLKDTLALYDLLLSTTVTAGCLPERPERRAKEWRAQVEDFFQFVASSPELRTVPEFVSFMKPGEMSAECNATLYKESEFELLTTFFTPLTYPAGLPGTHHEVEIIGKDLATPTIHNPIRSRRSYPSISNGRGSIHVKKNEGDEEATFIIREESKDVLIISEEHDRFVVVAGTFKKLVEQLACEEKPDPKYVTTFLLGHRHFALSEDLVSLLIKRFNMTEAPDATGEELAYAEKWRYVIQLRVLDIISFWMKSFWYDFQRRPQALKLLQEFIQSLHSSTDSNFSSAAISMSNTLANKLTTPTKNKRHSSSSSSNVSSPSHSVPVSPIHKTIPMSNMDINTFSGIQLARQLTLIELEFLRAIEVYEFAFYTWNSSDEGRQYRKNLDAYIARFNKVSYWVASEILNHQDEKLRGSIIEKFIEVAKHSQELKNFNSTVSIVTGISSTCVRRLEKSWKHVSERGLRLYNKLKLLITPTNNHSEYRKTLYAVSIREACVPYFGVFMRDITLCNEGTPKKLKNGLYNFSKLRTLVMMFEDIRRYQRSKFQFPSDDRLQNYCMNIWSLEEHELYDISCMLEPRELVLDSSTDS